MTGTAASAARAVASAATCAAAFLVPLIYAPSLAAPFTVPKQTILELGAALSIGALLVRLAASSGAAADETGSRWFLELRQRIRPLRWGIILVLGSVALSAAIADRAPGAPYAAPALLRWVALFGIAGGVIASGGDAAIPARLLQSVTVSAALVSLIGLLQHLDLFALPVPVISTPGSTFGNRNLGAEAVALSIPFGLGALVQARSRQQGERRLLAAALVLEVMYLAATRARGAWLGGLMGVLTFALTSGKPWPRRTLLMALGVSVLALVVAVVPGRSNPRYAADAKRFAKAFDVVGTSFDPDSPALRTRLGLWRRSLTMLETHPVVGIGPGNWAVLFPRYAEPRATIEGVLSANLAPRNAHCDLLECLTETGWLGLGSLLILAYGVTTSLRRDLRGALPDDPRGRHLAARIAAATLIALVGVSLTGFPLEMPATLTLAGLALGLAISIDGRGAGSSTVAREARSPSPPTWVAVLAGLVLLTFAGLAGEARVRGSYWLGSAERAVREDHGPAGAEQAIAALGNAFAASPGYRVALRTAQAELRLHHILEATRACDAAVAIEPYSPNPWATLAAVQLEGGDPHSAWLSARHSLELLNDHPLALSVRARAAEALGDTADAQAAWQHLRALAGPERPDQETARSARELLASHAAAKVVARAPSTPAPPTAQARSNDREPAPGPLSPTLSPLRGAREGSGMGGRP